MYVHPFILSYSSKAKLQSSPRGDTHVHRP